MTRRIIPHRTGSIAPLALGPTVLLKDTFHDVDGTPLPSHTMDIGPGWTAGDGAYQIQSNTATPSALTGGDATARSDSGKANVTATIIFNVVSLSNEDIGVTIRDVDVSNGWVAIYAASVNEFLIDEYSGGVFTQRASSPIVATTGSHTITFNASGNVLTATLDGVLTLTFTSSLFNTATQCGLYYDTSLITPGSFSFFEVTTP